jgi:hypothetical protein
VRRRELASRLLGIGCLDLLVALSAYAAYLLVQRVLGLPDRALPALLIALSGSVLTTAVRAAFRVRLSLFGAAVLADERLQLKERVSSAVYLDRHPERVPDPAWGDLVRRDGARSLAGVDVARHFPIRIPRLARWILLPAGLAALLVFLPPLDLLGLRRARQVDAAMRSEVERKREELKKAIEELKKDAEKPPSPDIQKALEALQKRLDPADDPKKKEEPPPPGGDPKKEAMVEFARLEEALRRELDQTKFSDLKQFLDRFPPGSLSRSPLSAALREALKQGTFGKAGEELKKLKDELQSLLDKKRSGDLTPEELEKMKKLSEELARLAKDSSMLAKLSSGFSGAAGGLSAGDLAKALQDLESLEKSLQSLEQLLEELKFLEQSLELAQLSAEDLAQLGICPDCGKVAMQPGGT